MLRGRLKVDETNVQRSLLGTSATPPRMANNRDINHRGGYEGADRPLGPEGSSGVCDARCHNFTPHDVRVIMPFTRVGGHSTPGPIWDIAPLPV